MASRRRATADETGPDPAIVRRILVRDHAGRDLPLADTGNDPVSEIAEEIVIVTATGNVTGLDALVPATKLRSQRRKIQRTTPNATITMIATGRRIVIVNVSAIVSAVRNTVPGTRLHISNVAPFERMLLQAFDI